MEKVYILPGLRTALLGKPAITNLGLFPSVNNVSVPLPPYEQTRAELQRMCLETFSELIRERYLSPEEMSYIYGYNQPSKQDTEHRPPEYIADPILFRLSTPPWAPRGGPLLPSRQATPERWKFPQPPPAASVPQPAQRPHHPRGSPADRRPRHPRGETSEPWYNFANRDESLLEPSVSWLPDGEFFRTTSALERPPPADTETMLENSEEARAAVRGASIAQQHRPSEQQHRPSRMRQFSDYTPSNESLSASTEVLLPDPTATVKKQKRGDARRKSNDDASGGDSFHQGTKSGIDPKSIPSLR